VFKPGFRKKKPTREVIKEYDAADNNGKFRIYKLSDGSYSSDYFKFLFQSPRWIDTSLRPFCADFYIKLATKKKAFDTFKFKPPSEWQMLALKRFGVDVNDKVTHTQAYFFINDLLKYQGIEYSQFYAMARKHSLEDISLLPPYRFGIEIEFFTDEKTGLEKLKKAFEEAEIPLFMPMHGDKLGIDHDDTPEWKIVRDDSLTVSPKFTRKVIGCEAVSPKLFGAVGFDEISKVLAIIKKTTAGPDDINKSCGLHVHVDAHDLKESDLLRLALLWWKIEVPIIHNFVSASRRNNEYCKNLSDKDILMVARGEWQPNNHSYRNRGLNLHAYERHESIEFRSHHVIFDAHRVTAWIIFCLKLTDAVRQGLTYRDIKPDKDSVLTACGLTEHGSSPILAAKEAMLRRYKFYTGKDPKNRGIEPPSEKDIEEIEKKIAEIGR
jgi:hypothetical protein